MLDRVHAQCFQGHQALKHCMPNTQRPGSGGADVLDTMQHGPGLSSTQPVAAPGALNSLDSGSISACLAAAVLVAGQMRASGRAACPYMLLLMIFATRSSMQHGALLQPVQLPELLHAMAWYVLSGHEGEKRVHEC